MLCHSFLDLSSPDIFLTEKCGETRRPRKPITNVDGVFLALPQPRAACQKQGGGLGMSKKHISIDKGKESAYMHTVESRA